MKKTVNPRSLKNLRKWQKGESGNPNGRPRKPISEALQVQLAQIKKGDRQKRTFAELIAAAQIRKAVKGNTMAAKEIADRVEGKPGQAIQVDIESFDPIELHVRFVDSDQNGRPADDTGEKK